MASRRVLVVEDDRDIRESLCEVLQNEGYDVSSAADGREALDALRLDSRPCVVLLDLMMPVMNGWEFMAEARRDQRLAHTPVVVVSAHTDKASTIPEAAAFLRKPVNLAQLLDVVRRHCAE